MRLADAAIPSIAGLLLASMTALILAMMTVDLHGHDDHLRTREHAAAALLNAIASDLIFRDASAECVEDRGVSITQHRLRIGSKSSRSGTSVREYEFDSVRSTVTIRTCLTDDTADANSSMAARIILGGVETFDVDQDTEHSSIGIRVTLIDGGTYFERVALP